MNEITLLIDDISMLIANLKEEGLYFHSLKSQNYTNKLLQDLLNIRLRLLSLDIAGLLETKNELNDIYTELRNINLKLPESFTVFPVLSDNGKLRGAHISQLMPTIKVESILSKMKNELEEILEHTNSTVTVRYLDEPDHQIIFSRTNEQNRSFRVSGSIQRDYLPLLFKSKGFILEDANKNVTDSFANLNRAIEVKLNIGGVFKTATGFVRFSERFKPEPLPEKQSISKIRELRDQ